jgi:hypothetical protein
MKEEHMNASDVVRYRKPVTFLLVAWFVFAVATSAAGFYRPGAGPLPAPAPVGLSVVLPVVIFWIWMATSPSFRAFALSLNPRVLTFVQSWRLGGFVFLVLAAHGLLPYSFAGPAGWGDMFIGATAPWVAMNWANDPQRSGRFIFWNLLGVADLVMAVTLGVLSSEGPAGILVRNGLTTRIMTELPMSLIPTFAVPLLLIFHTIVLAQMVSRRNEQLAAAR